MLSGVIALSLTQGCTVACATAISLASAKLNIPNQNNSHIILFPFLFSVY